MKNMIAIASTVILAAPAFASTLKFENARVYLPMKGSTMTAAYFETQNADAKAKELKIKSFSGFEKVELHETLEKDGRMKMEMVNHFTVPASAKLELKEGGKHIMLFTPAASLKVGQKLKAEILVDDQEQEVSFLVIERK